MSEKLGTESSRRLRRLYSNQDLDSAQFISLTLEESRHALKSLRLKQGDACLIVNGKGWEAEAKLKSITHDCAEFELISSRESKRGFLKPVRVLPSFIKKGKMDMLVEKAQEFGVDQFQPLMCERSEFEISEDRFESVKSRWEKISKEASKQSGSSKALSIKRPIKLTKVLSALESDTLVLMFHTGEPAEDWVSLAQKVRKNHTSFSSVIALIGPEGGFSQREIQLALDCNHPQLKIVSMGNTVLKADTAFIAALAGISFFISI